MEERKSNKKTRNIIIVSMLVLLLAILCLCGTTFARYITETKVPTQQATVAKWGFVVNANADNLFSDKYENNVKVSTGGDVVRVTADTLGEGENATSVTNVVAPGTSGSMTFSVSGKAEVLAQVKLTIDKLKRVSLKATGIDEYTPVQWTLKKGTVAGTYDETVIAGTTLEKVKEKLDTTDSIAVNTQVDYFYELSWEWLLENDGGKTDEAEKKAAIALYNKYDTLIGYAAQGVGKYENEKIEVQAATEGFKVIDSRDATPVTYDITTVVAFDLSISVQQIQTPVTEP